MRYVELFPYFVFGHISISISNLRQFILKFTKFSTIYGLYFLNDINQLK